MQKRRELKVRYSIKEQILEEYDRLQDVKDGTAKLRKMTYNELIEDINKFSFLVFRQPVVLEFELVVNFEEAHDNEFRARFEVSPLLANYLCETRKFNLFLNQSFSFNVEYAFLQESLCKLELLVQRKLGVNFMQGIFICYQSFSQRNLYYIENILEFCQLFFRYEIALRQELHIRFVKFCFKQIVIDRIPCRILFNNNGFEV